MWRITPGQALRLRQYDDQVVLFNDLSGDTHLLGDAAVQLLAVLQQGPASEAALLAALADGGPDPELAAALGPLLASLAGFFLIEHQPC